MKKDAYYFSHDSNAKDDPKCMILIDQLGLEGYGIFWVLVETLRDQPNYKYPIKLLPILAKRYNTSAEKMNTVLSNYNLFAIENDEFFFSISLNERMKEMEERRENARKAGQASGRKRRKLNDSSTAVQQSLNSGSTIKINEINETNEVKKNKTNYIEINGIKPITDNSNNDNINIEDVFNSIDLSNLFLYIKKHDRFKLSQHLFLKKWEDFKLHCLAGGDWEKEPGAYYKYFVNWLNLQEDVKKN